MRVRARWLEHRNSERTLGVVALGEARPLLSDRWHCSSPLLKGTIKCDFGTTNPQNEPKVSGGVCQRMAFYAKCHTMSVQLFVAMPRFRTRLAGPCEFD